MKENRKLKVQKVKSVALSYASIWALILIVLAFYIINPNFLNAYNIKNLLTNMAPLLVMACGATFVRLLGSLDLSMGAVCSCANVILVKLMPSAGAWAYAAAVGFGILTGFLLGVIHAKLKIPSFIASLGMMNVYNSVALLITDAPMTIAAAQKPLVAWARVTFGVIGITTIIAAVIMLLLYFLQKRTSLGKSISMIGANERTARISGIHVDRTKIFAFTICGMASAVSGLLLGHPCMSPDQLHHLISYCIYRIQGRKRILEDHGDLPSADLPKFCGILFQDIFSLKKDLTPHDLTVGRAKPQYGFCCNTLSTS